MLLPNQVFFPALQLSRHDRHLNISLFSPQILYLGLTRASAYQITCCLSTSCSSAALECKFRLFKQNETWTLLELTDVRCSVDLTLKT